MSKEIFWSVVTIAFIVGFATGITTQTIRDPIGWFLLGLAFASIVIFGVSNLTVWMMERFDRDTKAD